MPSPRIKICGITTLEDARHCERCGVDALGFVFVGKSRRYISVEQAAAISAQLGPFVTRTGLFLDDDAGYVAEAISAMPDLLLQFHGREPADYCDNFDRPYIKAIGVGSGLPDSAALAAYTGALAFMFDSNAAGELGGTGHSFDWQMLAGYTGKPLILAGGLTCENVVSAIDMVQPYAVDVSTGVESAPGQKDHSKITGFINLVRAGA